MDGRGVHICRETSILNLQRIYNKPLYIYILIPADITNIQNISKALKGIRICCYNLEGS